MAQAVQVSSVDCPVIPVITMVRLITAFAFALVANADYICTTTPSASTVDCQCLTMVDQLLSTGRTASTVRTLAPGAENGQSDFTITDGAITYKFPDGQELCVTHPSAQHGRPAIVMAPCDYQSEGGFFIRINIGESTGNLEHLGKSTWGHPRECLEPNLFPEDDEFVSVGECSSSWTISSTPLCSSKSEMVIS